MSKINEEATGNKTYSAYCRSCVVAARHDMLVFGLTLEALQSGGVLVSELCPWKVIVRDGDRPRVMAALSALPHEIRPRPQTSACRHAVLRLDEGLATAVSAEASAEGSLAEVRAAEGDAEDEVEADSQGLTEGRMDIVIEKTFFHVREPDCAWTSYTKSTTDAHGVANHRVRALPM